MCRLKLYLDRNAFLLVSAILRLKNPIRKDLAKYFNCSEKTIDRLLNVCGDWAWRELGANGKVYLTSFAQLILKGCLVEVTPDH